MLDNKDIWLDAEEVAKRLKARAEKNSGEEVEVEEKPKRKRKTASA
jgi:hypothetical protein